MNSQDIFNIVLAQKTSGGSTPPVLEDKSVEPDFSNGDVVVEPSEGYDGLSSVTIEKDSDLIATNVKKDITINGITGTFGNFETKSLTPDFSNGDVTVSPTSGYDGLSSVTIEKDSDLVAENIKKDVNVFGVVGTLESGGGQASEDLKALVERTITTFSNSEITSVGVNSFQNCTSLTNISLPNVTSIGQNAFQGCSSLTTISLPSATSLGSSSFSDCTNLTDISLPNATSFGSNAFYNCTSLTTISLPSATSFGNYAFSNCTSLTNISLPSVTSISSNVFISCTSLTNISLPSATSIGGSAFAQCTSLTNLSLPSVTSISSNAFINCTNLNILVLKSNTTCYLGNVSAFTGTPFASGGTGGTLYVPQDLISSYQADTKWSTVLGYNANNQIKAIEGSPYENA